MEVYFAIFVQVKWKCFFFGAAASLPFPPQKKNSSDHLMGGFWRPETIKEGFNNSLFQNDSSQNGFLLRSWWNMVKHDNSTKKTKKHHEITWCDSPWSSYDSVALRRRYLLVSGPEGLGQPRFHAWSVALPRTRMKFHVSVSCHKNTTFDIYIYTYTLAQAFCRSGRFASLKTWKNKKLCETFYNTLRYWSVKKHRDTTLASTRWF